MTIKIEWPEKVLDAMTAANLADFEGGPQFVEHYIKIIAEHKNSAHSGDCTRESWPCVRCMIDAGRASAVASTDAAMEAMVKAGRAKVAEGRYLADSAWRAENTGGLLYPDDDPVDFEAIIIKVKP